MNRLTSKVFAHLLSPAKLSETEKLLILPHFLVSSIVIEKVE